MLVALSALVALAQNPVPSPPESFAAGLRRLASRAEVTLALEPLYPRPGSRPATLGELAKLYDLATFRDGNVDVLASPRRTVLGLPKDEPIALEGVEQADAFLVLVGLLDDGAFRSLVSKAGLGLGDLKTDLQRTLFMAVVAPGGVATIQSRTKTGMQRNADGTFVFTPPDTSRDPRSARLSLGQGVRVFGKPLAENLGSGLGSDPPHDLNLYPREDDPAQAFGVAVTTSAPNASRPGALPKEPAWGGVPVDLPGATTVAELVARVRAATRQEIVVDPRLGSRRIVLVGDRAPARDLLLATAHALRATYRVVGPALLLTDDAQGLGSRASAWRRWAKRAEAGVAALVGPYRDVAAKRLRTTTLPDFDPEALTVAQRARLRRGRGLGMAEFPVGELTEAQRARFKADLDRPEFRGRYDESRVTLDAETRAIVRYAGLAEPVELTMVESALDDVFQSDPPSAEKASVVPTLSGAGQAVGVALTAPDLGEAIEAAQDVGLAEVWLVVGPEEARSERLRQAVRSAKAAGLRTWIALRPLAGPPPDFDLELRSTDTRPPLASEFEALAVALRGLDVDGVALLDPAPPGYRGWSDMAGEEPPRGYTPEARLDFLRRTGYDPIDVTPERLPWRLREAMNSTAFGTVYNSPPEPRLTLSKERLGRLDAALRAFRKAYPGRLALETVAFYRERIEEWPASQAGPPGFPAAELTASFPSPSAPPLRWRAVLPDGTPPSELSAPKAPFVIDLSKRKSGVAKTIRTLFGASGPYLDRYPL